MLVFSNNSLVRRLVSVMMSACCAQLSKWQPSPGTSSLPHPYSTLATTLASTQLLAPYLNSHPTLIQPPQSVDSRYLWSLSYSIQLIYQGLCQFLFLHLLSEDESCKSWVMFISHSFNAQCSEKSTHRSK